MSKTRRLSPDERQENRKSDFEKWEKQGKQRRTPQGWGKNDFAAKLWNTKVREREEMEA